MPSQIEGSRAVAETVALCRPEVIGAYPISPQTHIVERLSTLVKMGALQRCEYINVESEFAAMSVCIGASATGARTYTATASQGLLYMSEAVFNASGLGLPIVMTVANRAIGAPINIWNDHSDAMSQRDSGWIQLFVESNQEALDVHVQAFRLAEALSLPVMVCMDGFVLTHAVERVELPTQEQVDAFLPPFVSRQVLDPAHPITIGAMVGPEAFMEVRYLMHAKQRAALQAIPRIAGEFAAAFGRDSGGLVRGYRAEDAETVVVALGSVLGTLEDVIDELRDAGHSVGALAIRTFRPWPREAVRDALAHAQRVIVLEKAFAVGAGGIVGQNTRLALEGLGIEVRDVIAGLGGRPIMAASLRRLLTEPELPSLSFLDLDEALVARELARDSGPHAENMLRDLAGRT
ncbi:MAG TPA: transketolase C-terminal domain-containing protein [Solirubrobacter sp.]|nr:transketolase C-terminal domain-containing protein [Solirubrobacter sp.]